MMKLTRKKVIVGAVILAVLAAVFFYGGNAPGLKGWNPNEAVTTGNVSGGYAEEKSISENSDNMENKAPEEGAAAESAIPNSENGATNETDIQPKQEERHSTDSGRESEEPKANGNSEVKYDDSKIIKTPSDNESKTKSEKNTDSLMGMYDSETVQNKDIPKPMDSDTKITSEKHTCTLTVKCGTILDNIDRLKPEKRSLVPDNGVIFPEKEVIFYEGESVFNVLLREMKRAGIHLEYVNTPIYKSAYIEGINNLYEFDCGELSGWIYSVNGLKPNYGCSRYPLSEGDKIEFEYTCNLGNDIR